MVKSVINADDFYVEISKQKKCQNISCIVGFLLTTFKNWEYAQISVHSNFFQYKSNKSSPHRIWNIPKNNSYLHQLKIYWISIEWLRKSFKFSRYIPFFINSVMTIIRLATVKIFHSLISNIISYPISFFKNFLKILFLPEMSVPVPSHNTQSNFRICSLILIRRFQSQNRRIYRYTFIYSDLIDFTIKNRSMVIQIRQPHMDLFVTRPRRIAFISGLQS